MYFILLLSQSRWFDDSVRPLGHSQTFMPRTLIMHVCEQSPFSMAHSSLTWNIKQYICDEDNILPTIHSPYYKSTLYFLDYEKKLSQSHTFARQSVVVQRVPARTFTVVRSGVVDALVRAAPILGGTFVKVCKGIIYISERTKYQCESWRRR